MLFNPAIAPFAEYYLDPFKAAAASFGVEAIAAPVHDTSELEAVIAAQAREPTNGLVVIPDAFTVGHRAEITSLAAHYRLPAVYPYRQFTELGGLLSYGFDRSKIGCARPVMSIASSRAKSRPTCQCRHRPSSNW
jgi:putative ABC transport system substrate-binding protein